MRFRSMLLLVAVLATTAESPAKDRPIPIKVVVVTMFELGADTGDRPGELQYWVEREKLDRVIPFPQGYHDLRMNSNGVLTFSKGLGSASPEAGYAWYAGI